VALFRRHHDAALGQYPDATARRQLNETIRRMINELCVDLIRATSARIETAAVRSIDDARRQPKPLVGLSEALYADHLALKRFLNDRLYRHPQVVSVMANAQRVLREVFDALLADIARLPAEHRDAAQRAEQARGAAGRARVVADYVAGMTDRFAFLEHARLTSSR
jgi:dGTPase